MTSNRDEWGFLTIVSRPARIESMGHLFVEGERLIRGILADNNVPDGFFRIESTPELGGLAMYIKTIVVALPRADNMGNLDQWLKLWQANVYRMIAAFLDGRDTDV